MRATTRLLVSLLALPAFASMAATSAKPLRVLYVTGGCCHDYNREKVILSQGVSARANVQWTIVQEEGQGDQEGAHPLIGPTRAKDSDPPPELKNHRIGDGAVHPARESCRHPDFANRRWAVEIDRSRNPPSQ